MQTAVSKERKYENSRFSWTPQTLITLQKLHNSEFKPHSLCIRIQKQILLQYKNIKLPKSSEFDREYSLVRPDVARAETNHYRFNRAQPRCCVCTVCTMGEKSKTTKTHVVTSSRWLMFIPSLLMFTLNGLSPPRADPTVFSLQMSNWTRVSFM